MTNAFSTPAQGGLDEPPDAQREALQELVRAAASGDRAAAGAYFAQVLPTLALTAKRIAGITHDADDLLGEALLVVLAKWSEGTGPTENVPAYIAQTMRNRIRDDFRSPRSKVAPLDHVDEPVSHADPRIRELEIESELAIVRRALAELPEDQQRVLIATVLEGRKPRDLEEHLARPAAAIYSLSRRARGNLRRSTLRILLEEDGRPDCIAAAQQLPEAVGDTPEETKAHRASEHYRTCPHCRRSWSRFAGLATLGTVPLAGALALTGPAGSAEAAELDGGDDGEATGESSGSLTEDPGAPADPSSATEGGVWERWGRTAATLATAGSALVLTAVLVITYLTQSWIFAPKPDGQLVVSAESAAPDRSRFLVDLSLQGESWTVRTLRIELSTPVDAVTAPAGWSCIVEDDAVSCTTASAAPRGGVFEVRHAAGGDDIPWTLVVDGDAEHGSQLKGTSSGTISR
ncbi:sigma-70 family RNA polymerase sigma factor [Microbacterium sp. 179-I 3D4 NHS]|uniref:sigma-70 family RNA polymerase sigma factor n=1 Tax=Microbacterium sp. 179-I 3D4 NHS TaxID=3142381 RepID=UPI0039A2B3B1